MSSGVPRGCGASVKPLYYNLCDLDAAWGVAVEAVAAAGGVVSFVLLVFLLGVGPLVGERRRRQLLPLQVVFTLCTLGLFGLALAFVAGRDFTTCAARRFLFGVLFAGCLACLATHGLWLALLGGREDGGRGPRRWLLHLGGLALWLVEVMVNTEWLIITMLRSPLAPPAAFDPPAPAAPLSPAPAAPLSCSIANQDFVMALVYVMALLLVAVAMAVPALVQEGGRWRRDGALLLATGLLTGALWAAWIGMYVHGNAALGRGDWDDPALALALVANGWLFLLLYVVPEACLLEPGRGHGGEGGEEEGVYEAEHAVYPARGPLVYAAERTPAGQNLYLDNTAFTMDEPRDPEEPVTPEGPRPGPLRRGVYQPTEMALINRGLTYRDFHQTEGLPPDFHQPVASAPPVPREPAPTSMAWPLPPPAVLRHADSGLNGPNRKPLW